MKQLIQQVIKFGIVGVIATLIDWSIFYSLYNLTKMDYLLAKTIAFGISTIFNYYLSMKYVFVSKFSSQERHKEFQLFVGLSILGLLLTLSFLWLMVEGLNISANIANILVAVIVTLCNFILRKALLEHKA